MRIRLKGCPSPLVCARVRSTAYLRVIFVYEAIFYSTNNNIFGLRPPEVDEVIDPIQEFFLAVVSVYFQGYPAYRSLL